MDTAGPFSSETEPASAAVPAGRQRGGAEQARPGPAWLQDGHQAPRSQGPVPKEHSLGQGEDNLLAEGEAL